MTAPVIAPNGDSPLNVTLRLICWLLTVRIADLEHQVQAARQSCEDEQADHQRTRLLGRDRTQPTRRDLGALVGGAVHRRDGRQWRAGGGVP
jgi:uncharacterized protein YcfJ